MDGVQDFGKLLEEIVRKIWENWQFFLGVLTSIIGLITAAILLSKARGEDKLVRGVLSEKEKNKQLCGPYPELQKKALKVLHQCYSKQAETFFPADELPKVSGIGNNDLDLVLQHLRSVGFLEVVRHPVNSTILIRLTGTGADWAYKRLNEK